MIPIFEPYLTGNEGKYIEECISTNWISSQGKFINNFENSLAAYHGCKYCVVTSSCTAAIHLSLKALGINDGDEVICPALTFIAPANMIVLSGAKLVLVDIDEETFTIDPKLISSKITKKTKAIIVVHQFGHAAHMTEIINIAKKYNLKIIEDNAESIGGQYKGKLLGTLGDVSTFSFFGNKIISTGEGGAIITNNASIAEKAKSLRDHGMSPTKKYHHLDLGYNYRMTNMQAAVGLAQIEKLNEILEIRNLQMQIYYENLNGIKGVKLRKFANWIKPVHWLLTISIDKIDSTKMVIEFMKQNGVDCRQMINPVFNADHFKNKYNKNDFFISSKVSKQYFHLPSSTALTKENILYICKLINTISNQI